MILSICKLHKIPSSEYKCRLCYPVISSLLSWGADRFISPWGPHWSMLKVANQKASGAQLKRPVSQLNWYSIWRYTSYHYAKVRWSFTNRSSRKMTFYRLQRNVQWYENFLICLCHHCILINLYGISIDEAWWKVSNPDLRISRKFIHLYNGSRSGTLDTHKHGLFVQLVSRPSREQKKPRRKLLMTIISFETWGTASSAHTVFHWVQHGKSVERHMNNDIIPWSNWHFFP